MKHKSIFQKIYALAAGLMIIVLAAGCSTPADNTPQAGSPTLAVATARPRESLQPSSGGTNANERPTDKPALLGTQLPTQTIEAFPQNTPDPNLGPTATFVPTPVPPTPVPTSSGGSGGPTFPSISKRVAFSSDVDGDNQSDQILTMNADGSDQKSILTINEDDVPGFVGTWSPDGTKIVFEQGQPPVIAIVNSDGTSMTVIPNQPDADNMQPIWSPDGKWIAFSSIDLEGQSDLWLIRPDGSQSFRVTNDEYDDTDPAWSPDGNKIIYISSQDDDLDIYAVDVSAMVKLAAGAAAPAPVTPSLVFNTPQDEATPMYFPDGKRILFAQFNDQWDLYVYDTSNASIKQLTNTDDDEQFPALSSDGTQIILISNRDEQGELYRMLADGGDMTRLTTDAAPKFRPMWQK